MIQKPLAISLLEAQLPVGLMLEPYPSSLRSLSKTVHLKRVSASRDAFGIHCRVVFYSSVPRYIQKKRPPSSPSRCSVRVLIGSVPPGRVSRVVWFNPVRPKSGLCAVSGDFARGRVKRTQVSLLFDVGCSVVPCGTFGCRCSRCCICGPTALVPRWGGGM